MKRKDLQGADKWRPRVRHVWRGYALGYGVHFGGAQHGGASWPERWVVYIVQRKNTGSGWDFYVYAELRGTCRPEVWDVRAGEWLPPRFIPGPAGVHVNREEPFPTLGAAREDAKRLAYTLMYDRWVERRIDYQPKGRTSPAPLLHSRAPDPPPPALNWVWRKYARP
jgi:hypothetical protein